MIMGMHRQNQKDNWSAQVANARVARKWPLPAKTAICKQSNLGCPRKTAG